MFAVCLKGMSSVGLRIVGKGEISCERGEWNTFSVFSPLLLATLKSWYPVQYSSRAIKYIIYNTERKYLLCLPNHQ